MLLLTRFLRRQIGKLHHRASLLEEYQRLGRRWPMPAGLVSHIMRRPADAEDWIHLLSFIDPEEPVFLVDVGANIGDFTAGFLACYEDARAVCLEPTRATFDRLQARFVRHPRVTCLKHAIGDRDGDLELTVYPATPAMNTFQRYEDRLEQTSSPGAGRQEIVTVRTLPSAVTLPSDRTVVVKIDVQGHEVAVMDGAGGWFAGVDAVLCETSFGPEYVGLDPSFACVTTRLAAHDLYPVVFQPSGHLFGFGIERDVLFVKRSRLDRMWTD